RQWTVRLSNGRRGLFLRVARTMVRALIVTAVAVGAVVPVTVASAAPSAGNLQQQIDEASANLEKIVEQYDKVTEDLKATQAGQAALSTQIGPLQEKMDAAYAAIGDLAARAYKGAPMGTGAALLEAGSPANLIDQLSTLDQIGRQRHTEIEGYEQAKSQ